LDQYVVNGIVAVLTAAIVQLGNSRLQRRKNEPAQQSLILERQDRWEERLLMDALAMREEVEQLRDGATQRFNELLGLRANLAECEERTRTAEAEAARLRRRVTELGYPEA
jgi:hypothetical protein